MTANKKKKAYMCSGRECELLRHGVQTYQFEMQVTMLTNVKTGHLRLVTMYFLQYLIRDKLRNISFERSNLVAAVVASESNARNRTFSYISGIIIGRFTL